MTSRVFFEEADRPPPSYFENSLEEVKPLKKVPFQTPDPDKWISAPEFVPRSKLLADAFSSPPNNQNNNFSQPEFQPHTSIPYAPFCTGSDFYDIPITRTNCPPPPIPPRMPFDGIPAGYTANMTTINPSNGPPIAAILLRKKRKRRSKNATNSMINTATHSISPCSSHPSDPNGDFSSSDEYHQRTHKSAEQHEQNMTGSCPDLSKKQIQKWDDYLYQTAKAVNNGERVEDVFEIAPAGVLESAKQTIFGTSNKELQNLDNEINGNTMTSSMVLKRLANHTFMSPGSIERSLADEMDELSFRPPITRYGYPQIDNETSPYVHITSMDPKNKKIKSSLIDKEALKAYLDEADEEEEDYLEGLNITVNNFDACDDLTLSDIEVPSRFQQIQEAIRKNTVVISTDLQAPDRVCCAIM